MTRFQKNQRKVPLRPGRDQKAKLLPRGGTALPLRTPTGDPATTEKDSPGLGGWLEAAAAPEQGEEWWGTTWHGWSPRGWRADRLGFSSQDCCGLPTTHNHKVPVLISPTLKHTPADVQLIGTDSQGNKFKLLSEHQVTSSGDKDRPPGKTKVCPTPTTSDETTAASVRVLGAHGRASRPDCSPAQVRNTGGREKALQGQCPSVGKLGGL